MTTFAKLARIERIAEKVVGTGAGRLPFFIVYQYADESMADAVAAYPDLPWPDDIDPDNPVEPRLGQQFEAVYDNALVWYMDRQGSRPDTEPVADVPGYYPGGLVSALNSAKGKTATIGDWRKEVGHEPEGET